MKNKIKMVEHPASLTIPGSLPYQLWAGCLHSSFMGWKNTSILLTHRSQVSFTHTEPQPNTPSNRKRIQWNHFPKKWGERGEQGTKILMLSATCLWGLSRGDTVILSSHGNGDYSFYIGSHLNNRIYRTILNDCCLVRQQMVNTHT